MKLCILPKIAISPGTPLKSYCLRTIYNKWTLHKDLYDYAVFQSSCMFPSPPFGVHINVNRETKQYIIF